MALGMKWRLGLRYLCYVHGEDITTARDSREYVFLVQRVLRGAEMLIANSNNTKRILCDEWDSSHRLAFRFSIRELTRLALCRLVVIRQSAIALAGLKGLSF